MSPNPVQSAARRGLLTTKEREVMALLGIGRTRMEIAAELGKSPKTVDAQMQAIRHKLGLRSMSRLVVAAMNEHLILNPSSAIAG